MSQLLQYFTPILTRFLYHHRSKLRTAGYSQVAQLRAFFAHSRKIKGVRELWEGKKKKTNWAHTIIPMINVSTQRIRDKSLSWEFMEEAEGQNETENKIKMANDVDFDRPKWEKL